jgi:hypothetical protein
MLCLNFKAITTPSMPKHFLSSLPVIPVVGPLLSSTQDWD